MYYICFEDGLDLKRDHVRSEREERHLLKQWWACTMEDMAAVDLIGAIVECVVGDESDDDEQRRNDVARGQR